MGLYLTLLPYVMSAAGAGMSIAGAEQSKKAMNRQLEAELLRQKGYQKPATAAFEESLAQSGRQTAEEQIAEGEAQRAAAYKRVQGESLRETTSPIKENTSVNQVRTSQNEIQNRGMAGYQGLTAWQLKQMIKTMKAQQQLQRWSNFAQGSAAVSPYEVQNASYKGDSLSGAGSLVSALGMLAGVSGLGMKAATTPTAAAMSAYPRLPGPYFDSILKQPTAFGLPTSVFGS